MKVVFKSFEWQSMLKDKSDHSAILIRMPIGDLQYWYDQVVFQLQVVGAFGPSLSSSSGKYALAFKPIVYDKVNQRVTHIRIESVVSQNFGISSKYEAHFNIRDHTGKIVQNIDNTITWGSFPDAGVVKANGQTTAMPDLPESYTIDGYAVYDCIPGVAPFTTATANVNIRVYYEVTTITNTTPPPPSSGGGGTATPEQGWAALLPGLAIASIIVAGIFALGYASEKTGINAGSFKGLGIDLGGLKKNF